MIFFWNSNIPCVIFQLSKKSCHKKSRATKRYSLRKAPNVLVVHLKRFDFSVNGKLSHHVAYPETLNLKNLSQAAGDEKNSKSSMYQLYGVLVHLGHTSRSGHYYSYVKGPNDTWLRADDSRVNINDFNRKLNYSVFGTTSVYYLNISCFLRKSKDVMPDTIL